MRARSPREEAIIDASIVTDASIKLAPLTATSWLQRLDLGEGDVAFVALPMGATQRRPVMLAVHGAAGRPEWSCGGWHNVTDGVPLIVCPQGTAALGAFS